ncbi:PLP-dependent aminotransferase family protein [Paralcaligenes sp. KSB-10]|uniref:aminotransferase-like domain-containing protein n=1 Tax=Paralcaligenes sp. KSB-10 TaxID=2901142 RepID=UPI001E4EF5E3|nr:PLP-dependent aminotransferase family protein [Paralcaligenes sp. KSB-10]UHL66318.1 PLP-dependent aminotransferase family protein [Paralcaligenes sp. KSB-10]
MGSIATAWRPVKGASQTLVEQIAQHMAQRMDEQVLRTGLRLPSIRALAQSLGVSRFTVVEAYDRLMALGLIESRRGSGFYVAARKSHAPLLSKEQAAASLPGRMDVDWLLRTLFQQPENPGVPAEWLDADLVLSAVLQVRRTVGQGLLAYGKPQGYEPLRRQISADLNRAGIGAHPEHHLLTTCGVTHALDLIIRHMVRPGDVVLVEDPAWYLVFARLAAAGVTVLGVPRAPDGPDLARLEHLAASHQPKLLIVNTAVHNPTGYTLSMGKAYEILRLAEKYDFAIIEDDTYSELSASPPVRLAALDQLNRVLLVAGYSKLLAASLRVGYIAAAPQRIHALGNLKMLAGMTSPEFTERIVYRVLADGHYRRHIERVRARADAARTLCLKSLRRLGLQPEHPPEAGLFVWVDCGQDTEPLVRRLAQNGPLLVPGSLFSPAQALSTFLRIPVSLGESRAFWKLFEECLGVAREV